MFLPEFLALLKNAEIPKPAASAVEEPVMLSEVELASCYFVAEHQKAVLGGQTMARHCRGCLDESRGS